MGDKLSEHEVFGPNNRSDAENQKLAKEFDAQQRGEQVTWTINWGLILAVGVILLIIWGMAGGH